MHRLRLMAAVSLLVLLCTGCWDRVEINRQAFVIAVGIDLAPQGESGEGKESGDLHHRPPRFLMSTEIAILRALNQQTGGVALFPPELTKPAIVLAGTGRTLFAIERLLASRMSRRVLWSHVKTVVVGEAAAREYGLFPIMDFLTRDVQFHRRIRLAIAEGEAHPFLETTMLKDTFSGDYIANVLDPHGNTGRTINVTLNQLDGRLHESGNALVPRVKLGDGEVQTSGAGVIKQGKLVAWLSDLETQWVNFATDEIPGGTILVADPEDPAEEILFGVVISKTRLTADVADGRLTFSLRITTEGDILERVLYPRTLDQKVFDQVAKAVEQAIEDGVLRIVKRFQHELQVDVLGFGDYLQRRLPHVWKQVKENWDEVGFRHADVTVEADVTLLRRGSVL